MKNGKKISFSINKRISDHLIQVILIFTSVFLAFWLNQYLIEKNELKAAEVAREAILKEMKWNLKILEKWSPYHKELYDKTLSLTESEEFENVKSFQYADIVDPERGIMRETLLDNAWNLLKENQIMIELDLKMDINRMYNQQAFVNGALTELMEFLRTREVLRDEYAKENYIMFANLIGELYGQESAMIREQKLVIERLEKP